MNKIFQKLKYGILIVRYLIYMVWFFIESLMVPIVTKFKGQVAAEEYKHKAVQNWCAFTFKVIGSEVEFIGQENIPDEHCLFVGNHQGILDIPALMLGANRTIGFIAKKELFKVPIMGRWIKLCHSVGIDREDPRDAVRVIKEGVQHLTNGFSLGIYPEGTRSKNGKIQEFKSGSLKLAIRAKVPVIPVTVDGTYAAYEENKKFKQVKIRVIYGKPIYVENLSKEEQKDLAVIIHDQIEKNLNN